MAIPSEALAMLEHGRDPDGSGQAARGTKGHIALGDKKCMPFNQKRSSPDFSPACEPQCLQAPKGRDNSVQANGLGFDCKALRQALKGRANPF